MKIHPGHFVAIFGGAVSGAEAAYQLSQRRIYVVVFEQHHLPYGKIEDGLPKWHAKLRDQEEQKIDEKLNNPYVHFVPATRLGTDIGICELEEEWGCSAIMLAIGAWSDRHLAVPGVDEYVNKGLYYQNPLVAWFNHYHEPNYKGPHCKVENNTVIIGGGLASLDVVKIVMLELVQNALASRGYKVDMFQLERVGIKKVLEELNLNPADLGVNKCHLYYRRRVIDMPISPDAPPDAPPEKIEKVHQVRKKIIHHFQSKYLFEFHEQFLPYDKIVENGRLVGMKFHRTEIVQGAAKPIAGTNIEVRASLFISSIGSIPEHIPSIASEGEIFRLKDPKIGKVTGYSNVFAIQMCLLLEML
jgi:NADPH-dependent glutamate synthase beta subunit-like oxidoreductase